MAVLVAQVHNAVQERVAKFVGWSMKHALSGKAPLEGFDGEPFPPKSLHSRLAGKPIAKGWRAAYFGMRFDLKARMQANLFERWYNCTYICESCMAQQPYKNAMPEMNYKDFRASAIHRMTCISHTTYCRTAGAPSPWLHVEGWTLGTAFRDPMHCVYLGICDSTLQKTLFVVSSSI